MAISNATRLSDFGSGIGTQGAVLSVNNTNSTIGLGTTNPQRSLEVIGPQDGYVSVGVRTMGVGKFTGIHFGYRENNNLYRK